MKQRNTSPLPSVTKGEQGVTPARGGRKLRNDLIFISALLLAVAAIGLGFFLLRGEGDAVIVEVDGKLIGTYPLSRDTVVDVRTGEEDGQLNRLVIRDGEAFVETATCPDGICSSHRPISREGESIVCLPHRVVITVVTDHANSGPDVIA
ncbi:MAG: NusG domain II-containing protein [Oscillospiraceae bacterium]|nr:NusG domain II-containing protein [Oscillospiraceae bacterium]